MTYDDKFKAPDKQSVYMAIHGGHKVYLDNPQPDDFDPLRTAYSLAHEHRYGGNYGPYSVAQHAVLVAECVAKLIPLLEPRLITHVAAHIPAVYRRFLLGALHHDDTESILGDLPQPVKSVCPDFKALERRLEAALMKRYGCNIELASIKEADRIVFCAEVRCLVPREHQHLYGEYGNPEYRRDLQPDWEDLEFWSPDQARKRYLQAHEEYSA